MLRIPAWAVRQWRLQQLYILVALAVYAIIVTLRLPISLLGTLVSALVCGNITTTTLGRLHFVYRRRQFPNNWITFVACLLLVIPVAVTVAVLVVARLLFAPEVLTWHNVGPYWEFSCLATVLLALVAFGYTETRQRLEHRALELEEALHQGVALLELQDQELQRAREIQESLLPREIPQVDGFEIAGTWHPARAVGGDYFDVLKFPDGKLSVCIADVVGKGVSAALLMANIQAAVRAFASPSASPAWVCARINDVLCGNIADDKFVTFFYGSLDTRSRVLSYSNAGHLPPIHLRCNGKAIRLTEGGMVLGVSRTAHYGVGDLHLDRGDRLLLFTDGITEAGDNGEEYGEQRIECLAREHAHESAAGLVDRVMADVAGFCNSQFVDDATMVVLAALPAVVPQESLPETAPRRGFKDNL